MKKNLTQIIAYGVASAVLAVSISANMPLRAEASTTKQQIEEAEKQKQKMEEEKQKAEQQQGNKEKEIGNLQFQEGNLKNQIENFNSQLETENANLQAIQSDISDKNDEINVTKTELEAAVATQEYQYEVMCKRAQAIYEQPDNMYLELILSANSFSTFLNLADYIFMLSQYDTKVMDDYKLYTASVEAKKAELDGELLDLEELEELNLAEQERITALIDTTNQYVEQYQAQIANANVELAEIEKQIAQKEAEIAAQEADIEALKKKYEEELRLSQIAQQAAWRDISEITFQENDRYLLANLIYCEAGGEPYEGQLAVGAVVINRVLSSKYPGNVYDVIYQPYQFSPAGSGRLALALAQNKATASCYQAADQAMAGNTNVGTCLYFRTPIPGLTGTQIGNHIFY